MDLRSQFGFLAEKSLSPWLAVWAIRYKWKLDYKLSPQVQLVRWGAVFVCYAFSPLIDVAALQICGILSGLTFLCWPNFAYHLTRMFQTWPVSEGRVSSSRESDSRWSVGYCFEFNGQQFGGTSMIKPIPGIQLAEAYPEGQPVRVSYDPLNPDNSVLQESPVSKNG